MPILLSLPQDYIDERTAQELRAFDLAAVLAAVRSYAFGGCRAPLCGIVDGPTPPVEHPELRDAPKQAVIDRDEHGYRGITRDNNGRQQYWIALLYASLE